MDAAVDRGVRRIVDVDPPGGFDACVRARIEAASTPRPMFSHRYAAAAASLAVALIAAGTILWRPQRQPGVPPMEHPQVAAVDAPGTRAATAPPTSQGITAPPADGRQERGSRSRPVIDSRTAVEARDSEPRSFNAVVDSLSVDSAEREGKAAAQSPAAPPEAAASMTLPAGPAPGMSSGASIKSMALAGEPTALSDQSAAATPMQPATPEQLATPPQPAPRWLPAPIVISTLAITPLRIEPLWVPPMPDGNRSEDPR